MIIELAATLGDKQRELRVEATDDGRWHIADGDTTHVVDARELRPGTWSVLIDGASWVVDLDARRGGVVALLGPCETAVKIEDARRKRLAEAVSGARGADVTGGVIRAPIAGKVVKLLVKVGDRVEVGAPMLVLEAMKMENEIRAQTGGTVATIHVRPGQSVETQEPLITFG